MKVITVLAKFKADLDAIGGDNMTPVHLAGQFNNAEMAKWVLSRGASSNTRANTKLRETPLMIASQYGSVPTMAQLVLADATLDAVDVRIHVYCESYFVYNVKTTYIFQVNGNNALHYAALYGQTESALFLLRVGMPKNIMNKVMLIEQRFTNSIKLSVDRMVRKQQNVLLK